MFAGVIRRSKRVVKSVRNSLISRNEFREAQAATHSTDPTLPQECGTTRWTAIYRLVCWMLGNQTAVQAWLGSRGRGSRTIAKHKEAHLSMALSAAEWGVLPDLRAFLQPLAVFVTAIQATKTPTLGKVIPWLAQIIPKVRANAMASQVDGMSEVVERHYVQDILRRFTMDPDVVNYYCCATLLTPAFKMHDRWPNVPGLVDGRAEALERMTEVWTTTFKPASESTNPVAELPVSVIAPEADWGTFSEAQIVLPTVIGNRVVVADELTQYLAEPPSNSLDVLEYWRDVERRWPNLAKMARQIFAIPATSAAPERVFSLAGRYRSPLRRRTSEETVDLFLTVARNTELLSLR
eukprot:GHVU01126689.1.p1 GENE.GHVU01126689.1~~GHVU01126689.1.p1  ORF type:complete len:351 (-),score=28.01 GHVU01126689.1:2129-3181(-)